MTTAVGQAVESADRAVLEREILRGIASGRDVADLIVRWRQGAPKNGRAGLAPREAVAAEAGRSVAALREALDREPLDERRLAALVEGFAAHDLLLRAEFDGAAAALDRLGAEREVRERLEETRARYLAAAEEILVLAEALEAGQAAGDRAAATARPARGLDAAVARARTALGGLGEPEPVVPILRASVLPYRRASLPPRAPLLEAAIVPSYLAPSEVPSLPADLAPSIEAPLADEILAKAAELDHDYARIYEFVRNDIETEWYAGGMKGALGTLLQGAGNDVDQASLLIALFRASKLPARYVHGVLELPVEGFEKELGLSDPALIADFLSRAGVAHAPVVRGGRVAAFQVEATWVAAHVPYTNYRGAVVDLTGRTWLPLAPAVKRYARTPAAGVVQRMGLDIGALIDGYLAEPQARLPLEVLRARVESFLRQESPAETYAEQLASRELERRALGLLPNTLPVAVAAVTAESPTLSAARRHSVRFRVLAGVDEGSPVVLDTSLPMAALAGRRVTFSYIPATVDDHELVNLWGGLEQVPAYLVRLRPQIKVDGRLAAVAEQAVDMAASHRLEVEVGGPAGTERVSQTLVAGGYNAVAIGAHAFAARPAPDDDPADTEYEAARLLSGLAYGYGARWDAAEDELGRLLDVAVARPQAGVVIAANAVRAEVVLGLRRQLVWEGVTLDAASRIAEPVARSGSAAERRDWMRLSALQGSALEHVVFEEQFAVDAISVDKGLGLVRQAGGTVHTVDAQNVASVLPSLGHPQAVKADVENWTRLGMVVEVPGQPILRNSWRGSLWRVEDPASGAAGYFLAGGLAGGATSVAPTSWLLEFLAEALAAPFSAGANPDPQSGASVVKVAATDGQQGTVGRIFATPLSVLVRDAVGRPVKGARVAFQIWAGGGALVAEGSVRVQRLVTLTNALGVAVAVLESGRLTKDNPVFVLRDPGDPHASRALANLVEVEVDSSRGVLVLGEPFTALGYAGPPHQLRRTDTTETEFLNQHPGAWAGAIQVVVEDELDNPISNADVTFTVGEMETFDGCSNPAADPRNAAVFDAFDQAACPSKQPLLGECGGPALSVRTSASGAAAGVILGNSVVSGYRIHVAAGDLEPLSFFYSVVFSQSSANGECSFSDVFRVQGSIVADDSGRNIEAVRPAWQAPEPKVVTLTHWQEDWEVRQRDDGTFFLHFFPTGAWQPAIPTQISLLVGNGGSASHATPVEEGSGRYQAFITAGGTPGFNDIRVSVTDIVVTLPSVDPATGVVTFRGTTISGTAIREAGGLWGVLPEIVAIRPDPVVLADDGTAAQPIEVAYVIAPPEYVADTVSVDIGRGDALLSRTRGTVLSGAGSIAISRGERYEREKVYTAELALNVGSRVEVKSDLVELPFFQRLIREVDAGNVRQDVDLLNQRVCRTDSTFRFVLNQDADVTLTIRRIEGASPGGGFAYSAQSTLIAGELRRAGEHTLPLNPGNVPPGDWEFELVAISRVDGHREVERGLIDSGYTSRDSLPVGHTFVKSVDVWDGHLTVSRGDFAVPGRGVPLELRRTYSSNARAEPGLLGLGWSLNYESRVIVTECGDAVVIGGEGSGMRFVDDGSGGLRPLKGHHGTLVFNQQDLSFDFYGKAGTRHHYARLGGEVWVLTFIEDTNGNVTRLTYLPPPTSDEPPTLQAVEDPSGRRLTFTVEPRDFVLWRGNVVTSVAGPGGLAVRFAYDEWGNLVRAAREGDGRVDLYGYDVVPGDSNMRQALASVINGLDGGTTRYRYSVAGIAVDLATTVNSLFVTELTEPEGATTRFAYDLDALSDRSDFEVVTRITDGRGQTSTYTLDQYGSPLEIADPLGDTTRMVWSPDDVVMTRRTDANGVVTEYTYDEHGNLLTESVEVVDFDGRRQRYVRETGYWPPSSFAAPHIKNRRRSTTDRNGAVRSYVYDGRGNLVEEATTVVDAGGVPEAITVAHTYGANGDRLTSTDGRGHPTFFEYEASGNLAAATDALGQTTRSIWDERSRRVSTTDPRGQTTGFEHDSLGRLVATRHSVVGGVVAVETAVYDDINDRQTVTDAERRSTVTQFDRQGRMVRVTNAGGGTKVYAYDAEGNKTLESGWFDGATPRVDVLFEYDAVGRLSRRTEPLGRVTTYEYDGVGSRLRETLVDESDPSFPPRVTERRYDALNRPIRLARATESGIVEAFTRYDGEGNKVLERDALGRETASRYDALNRLLEKAEPENRTTRFAYDGNGNLVRETLLDPVGGDQTRQHVYDEANRRVRAIDAEGRVTVFAYDAAGNLVREVDANGNATTHAFDERNRRVQTTRHLDRVTSPPRSVTTRFAYDNVGNPVETREANGNVVRQSFDALNRPLAAEDTLGLLWRASYDARGNRTTETDANGSVTVHGYDALDRRIRSDLPEGRTVRATWDVAGNQTSETDARGHLRRMEHDRLDRPVRTIDPAPFGFTTEATWDAVGNKLTETNRRGHTTRFAYDGLDRLVRVTGPPPSSLLETFSYDTAGNRISETDRRGIVTTHAYDRESRLLRTTRDGLLVAEHVYDAVANLVSELDALRQRVDYEYDERNLRRAEVAPLGGVTRETLDDMGDSVRTVDPEGRATLRTFDLRRRPRTETNGAGETTETSWDGKGNRTAVRRPRGGVWQYRWDGADRLVEVTDPELNRTSYAYDPNGNRTLQRSARGKETTFVFDELDRVVSMTYPGGDVEKYVYDANGNRARLRDAKGQETLYQHDELDREVLRTYPGGAVQAIASTYDANGNPLTTTDSLTDGGTLVATQTWDTFDRLSSVTNRYGETLLYSYDANGNRQSLRDPDGEVTLYGYDARNRLASVTVPDAGATNYSYFRSGLLQQVAYPNGTTATHTYDAANRVQRIENKQGSVLVSSYDYAYDANGNRTRQIEENGGPPETTTYTYDAADRLTEVAYPDKTVSYTLDPVGNRLREVTTEGEAASSDKLSLFDDRDRLLSISDSLNPANNQTFTYDPNGNLISRLQDGVLTEYLYDQRDHLVEVRRDGALVESYAYDHRGLRVRKAGSGTLLRYVYDDSSVLLQTDDFGNTIAKYEWGPDRLLSFDHVTEGRQFYLFDALGSPVDLMKPDGSLAVRYQWDAWGQLRKQTGESFNVFGFTGYERDEETGLFYAKARFYDPEVGRFLTRDAFEGLADTPPSLHKYLYAHARPTLYTDPFGTCVWGLPCPEAVEKAKEAVGETAEAVWSWLTSPAKSAVEKGGKALDETAGGAAAIDEGLTADRYSAAEVEEYLARYPGGTASAPGLEHLAKAGERFGAAAGYAGQAAADAYTAAERAQILAGTATIVWQGGKFVVKQVVKREATQAVKTTARIESATLGESTSGGVEVAQVQVTRSVPATTSAGRRSRPGGSALPPPSRVPNAAGTIVSLVTPEDRVFYRVFSGDNSVGAFLTSVRPRSRAFAQQALDLPPGNTAEFVQEVLVPAGTRLQRSRVRPGAFGGRGGAEQFELLEYIPVENFGPGVPLP